MRYLTVSVWGLVAPKRTALLWHRVKRGAAETVCQERLGLHAQSSTKRTTELRRLPLCPECWAETPLQRNVVADNADSNPSARRHDLGQLFDFIVGFKREHDGNSPTIREIMQGCGIPSTSVASYNLKLLERAGRIRLCHEGSRARRIEVVHGFWALQPGSAQAGG